ncbi:response regulator [Rheinheimera sp. MMS21-TC3]|uniref:response regulator n=1 Tax=Rheinheimera sp. MMS21-TC3 TaxID=3072790 RepID=UPI0028C40B3C|nr:response regulator [Rheinheimera sp. MMS21-TC3]WNO60296.1 response regulator [Rheinheimera sp. MMS21-TC3]
MTELKYPQQQAHILLVEDDEDDYILTREHLEDLSSLSCQLTWVKSAEDGIQHLLQGKYDVCLLDYQLGGQTGLALLQQAMAASVSTPIIMLTGQPDKQLDLQALEYGAADFLVKSELSETRFARAIRYALSRREYELERISRLRSEEDNRSKDRFLAHLSHEIRTPLSSILGYTELLLETDFAQKSAPELNIILNNGQHLLSLLNDVLDLSKITANKLELRPEVYSFASLIIDVYSLLEVTAADKGVRLSFNALNTLPEQVYLDGTRLKQILINIIHNAIKFTAAGSVTVDIWLQQQKLFFKVTDTGIGIPASNIKDIFSPFMQIEEMVKRKVGGAGLGLSIAAELIQRMQGKIAVASVEGVGSEFTFSVAAGDLSKSKKAKFNFSVPNLNRTPNIEFPRLTGRVLIVDDVAELRKLAGHWVQAVGAKVEFAKDGAAAIAKIKLALQQNNHYQLVLMDLHMPVVDGRDAVLAIRELGYQWPIVALTAATGKGLKQELTGLGFNNLLAKPINKSQLYQLLAAHLSIESKPEPKIKTAQKYLVVEDDIEAAELMQLFLQHEGLTVTLTHTAADCLLTLEQDQSFSTIVLDLGLPDSTGLALAAKIKQQYQHLRLVIVSGSEPNPAELQALGITKVLLKPVTRQNLSKLVNPDTKH